MNGTIMGATVSAALSDGNRCKANHAALLIVKSKCMSSYGNIIPLFPFSMTPWSRSFLTSECTALTSRLTLRATSRIDNSPTPVMAWMIAIRLGESVSCSKSQLTKDRNCPWADSSPFQAAINLSLVSSMLETLIFSVVMKLFSVSFYVSPEVSQQLPDVSKRNTNFCLANMLVIPFSGFVVVAQYTCVIDDISETVFVAMLAAPDRGVNLPDHQFCTSMLRNAKILSYQQLGWHLAFTCRVFNVVNNSNTSLVLSMKSSLDSMNSGGYTVRTVANTTVGCRNPGFTRAHNRASGFFVRKELPRLRIMVGRAGQPKGWPGSLVTGIATPARLATLECRNSGGEFLKLTREAATMATTLTQKRLGNTRAYHSNINLAHHAAMTSALLECASFLHGNACREAKRHQLDLLLIAEERMDELTELLQQGEGLLDSTNSGRYTGLAAANVVAGIGVPESNSAHNRASGFFVRTELPRRHIMVRRVGASQDAPGSELTGYAKPARLATLEIGVSGGELYDSEAATMATTLTQKRLGNTRAYHTNINLAHHAAMTSALLECASFLHGNACREAKRHQLDLLLIAEERMDELTNLLKQREGL